MADRYWYGGPIPEAALRLKARREKRDEVALWRAMSSSFGHSPFHLQNATCGEAIVPSFLRGSAEPSEKSLASVQVPRSAEPGAT